MQGIGSQALVSTTTNQSTNITQIGGSSVSLGQNTMSNSIPVVIASDQTNEPVKIRDSFGNNIGTTNQAVDINIKSTGSPVPVTAAGTVGSGGANTGSPVKIGGVYNSPAASAAPGSIGDLQLDQNYYLRDVEQYAPVAEDNVVGVYKVEQRFSYTYISTATTTVVKSGSGMLHSIVVNGGTAGTITIDDATSATTPNIAIFDSTNALATYIFDVTFTTGLTIVTSQATKITVCWR